MEEKKTTTTKRASKAEDVFAKLNALNVNGHTEKKKIGGTELTYLSWAWAWGEVKKLYPDATYTIFKDEHNRPYIEDPDLGIMVYTMVTIEGQTYDMWLPVMDGNNHAMKRTPYTLYGKTVNSATMFDINKTIMRCLVKNLAMFGLGLYIYAGEDLPETEAEQSASKAQTTIKVDPYKEVADAKTEAELKSVWYKYAYLQGDKKFYAAVSSKNQELIAQEQ